MYLQLIGAVFCVLFVARSDAFWCFECDSSDPGCGQEIDIMLERWKLCAGPPYYCMKVIERIGSNVHITRGCMEIFMRNTDYRLDMPTIRRHNYCLPGRNVDVEHGAKPNPYVDRQYCFCNDYNGCNPANTVRSNLIPIFVLTILTSILLRFR
ncbi:UPAR/Ly6 domain-containing protein crim-like [Tubulanus polymorphus]|uniref:UPAR/Ly6 domain-containing protein crim-like n=1 Tax=Tubulanus polymorphus TaxID=672921 RepID=UPI003DA4E053